MRTTWTTQITCLYTVKKHIGCFNHRVVTLTSCLRKRGETSKETGSLVPRPSPVPVFDRLQYIHIGCFNHRVYCKRSKTGAGEGLGTRLETGGLIQLVWANGIAGNRNETEMKLKLEMETENGNWKQNGNKITPITGALFSS